MRLKYPACILCAIPLLVAVLGPSYAADSANRKLYKWTDEQGIVHFGDHIPPEYANQEQHIVNSQGVETGRIEAQKTPEQVAADEQRRLDAEQRRNARRDSEPGWSPSPCAGSVPPAGPG